MKVAVSYPPLESAKGVALLSQNRQFQWFNYPTFIYPMVPASAATLLQSMGHEVVWDDAIAEQKTEAEWLAWFADAHLDLIALESKTPTIKKHWRLIERMKDLSPKTLVVLMGDHVTGFPEESLENSPVDYVLTGGDFDFSLRNLVNHLDRGAELGPGTYYRENGAIAHTANFSLTADLNELPFVDRDLTKWKLYAYKNGNFKYLPGTYTMFGRDCWWGHCTFCSWTVMFPGQKFRTRNPQSALDEVERLVTDYGVREIFDDTGTLPVGAWLNEFCEGLISRGLHKKVRMGCNMRFNYLSKEDYALMGKAGFRFILYGLESANQTTLKRLAKNMKTETIAQELRWSKGAGLAPHLTTMIGYPWESKEEARHTIDFAKKMFRTGCVDTLQATVIMPYAGTPLYKEAEKNGWLLSKDWDDYDMRKPVLASPLSAEDTLALTQDLYRAFISPQFVFNKLINVRTLEDVHFIWRGAKYVLGHLTDFNLGQVKEHRGGRGSLALSETLTFAMPAASERRAADVRSVSVLIPTLNSERTLEDCLRAIRAQDYPAGAVDIVVADGGSSDATLAIARNYGATIVANPLVSGESGKAAALRAATGELVALIDSDNIVIGTDWLTRMTAPFADAAIVASEPLTFHAEPGDGIVDRYCALMGANDPLCLFVGNYDRESAFSGTWTGVDVQVEDRGDYLAIALDRELLPTFGANGTLYRREALAPYVGSYLLDVDVPVRMARERRGYVFAKVRTSIRHRYCRNVAAFARKQKRRIRDYFSAPPSAPERDYPWGALVRRGAVRLSLSSVTVVPLLWQSWRAYQRSGDTAAFFHPVACWLTLWIYTVNFVFARGRALSRANWRQ